MATSIYYSCTKCRHSHVRAGSLPIACPSCAERKALEALSRPLRLAVLRQDLHVRRAADHADILPAGVA